MATTRKKVAIVGSGSGGMGALYALRNTPHEVHLFEADSRLGGHTNTVTFKANGESTPVDTGFFVLNTATYPNFIAMLDHLSVPTQETVMTFSVSRDYGRYEWAGTSLSSVFAQRSNLLNPRTWRMLLDIIRFNLSAIDLLSLESEATTSPSTQTSPPKPSNTGLQETLGSYLTRNKYSSAFINDYLLPMTAAVWSTPPDKCALEFPALTLVRFMWNHHLLSTLSARPPWLTILGGSSTYIRAILKYFPSAKIHLSTPVEAVAPKSGGKVLLDLGPKGVQEFDHVILATHGDQARKLLGVCATEEEVRILDCFQTVENVAVLHSDMSLMPTRPTAFAAWNILSLTKSRHPSSSTDVPDQQVSLTYDMTLLQSLPASLGPILVTLNPPHTPSPSSIQGTFNYSHPLYTPLAIRAQSLLPSIQHSRGISYAGAWTRYGFHEDGFSSGVKVAIDALGGSVGEHGKGAWVDSTFVRGKERSTSERAKRRLVLLMLMVLDWGIWWVWLPVNIVVVAVGTVIRVMGVMGVLGGSARGRKERKKVA